MRTRDKETGGVKGDGASRKKCCQKTDSDDRAIKSRCFLEQSHAFLLYDSEGLGICAFIFQEYAVEVTD